MGSEEESDGGFVKQEGTTSELEMDLSPRLRVVNAHEGFPSQRRREEMNERGVGGISKPFSPDTA